MHDTNNPRELRELALACAREGDGVVHVGPVSADALRSRRGWSRGCAAAAISSMRPAGRTAPTPPEANGGWLLRVPPDDVPFLPADAHRQRGEEGQRAACSSQLHLGKMPTEDDVAQATVFFLADRAVSGETFMPSGGLNVERSTTERELFGSPKQERLDQMRGRTVWLIGEHLTDYLGRNRAPVHRPIAMSRASCC